MLASPLLLQYDTAWQEKASAWVLLGLTVAMSAAMPAIPVVAAATVAAGTLRTAGKAHAAISSGLLRQTSVSAGLHNKVLETVRCTLRLAQALQGACLEPATRHHLGNRDIAGLLSDA